MRILIIWDVHSSNGKVLQPVGSGMGSYLHMARVSFEDTRMIPYVFQDHSVKSIIET